MLHEKLKMHFFKGMICVNDKKELSYRNDEKRERESKRKMSSACQLSSHMPLSYRKDAKI